MKTKKEHKDVRFEQLVAGAILKFGKIDSVGITLLSGGLLLDGVTLEDGPLVDLTNYIEIKNGTISLKEGFSLDETMCGGITLRKKLENYAGSKIINYLNSLNLETFLIRKIKQYCYVPVTKKTEYFSSTELAVLENLIAKGYVTKRWNNESIPDDFNEYIVTKKGEVALFKEDNADLLVDFIISLESECYDLSLLDDFLQVQNLSNKPQELLTLYNFEIFGILYNRDILSSSASIPEFKKLHYELGHGYDEESTSLILGLLEVLESDHSVIICHPNHIFNNKPVTKNNPQITRINWDNIDPSCMRRIGDYATFVDANEAYKYAYRRLRNQILPAIKSGKKDIKRYLVVVEKYFYDNSNNYVVRGIIRGSASGISIAFNPEYAKTITRDIWGKGLRLGDNCTPELYLKKQHPDNE